jgi:hypothetical protein
VDHGGWIRQSIEHFSALSRGQFQFFILSFVFEAEFFLFSLKGRESKAGEWFSRCCAVRAFPFRPLKDSKTLKLDLESLTRFAVCFDGNLED